MSILSELIPFLSLPAAFVGDFANSEEPIRCLLC